MAWTPRKRPPADRSPRRPLVVALGASAGGLDALQRFFSQVPSEAGIAYVVVQHLDPSHATLLPELLARHSALPVSEVAGPTSIKPEQVYITPPGKVLTLERGVLRPSPRAARAHPLTVIDDFFASLAEDQGPNAVAVVLSGTGSDGSFGLHSIKEQGGLAIAQAPGSAQFGGMPQSAAATGLVDFVLPPEEMPARLVAYGRHLEDLERRLGLERLCAQAEERIGEIVDLLERRAGQSFRGYKPSTLARRVQRRIQITHSATLDEYIARLADDREEAEHLAQDLLIGVTRFFRDPEAFKVLRRRGLEPILAGRKGVRIWIPGCSTGEEAYSIAILVAEILDETAAPPKAQIFATDVDRNAVAAARDGVFPASIVDQIEPRHLGRYFRQRGDTWEVRRSLREMCLFSVHNLLSQPPFTRLDLISCRNLLIYLGSELQQEVFRLFHHALEPGGLLFLGSSESPPEPELFEVVDRQARLYRAREHARRDLRRPIRLPAMDPGLPTTRSPTLSPQTREVVVRELVTRTLLAEIAPAAVLIDSGSQVVFTSGPIGRFLELPTGAASLDLLELLPDDLRPYLRSLLFRARREGPSRGFHTLRVGGALRRLRIRVRPMHELSADGSHLLIAFEDLGEVVPADDGEPPTTEVLGGGDGRLEDQLSEAREQLRATVDELETSNLDLQSSNQELQSINEELQSMNEELETSKEELQSANEELQTVNAELQQKLYELDTANADLKNLFASTEVATLFLDRKLDIARFTPAASEVFRLREADTGRPVFDITPRFQAADLRQHLDAVLATGEPRQMQVRRSEGDRRYQLRILPYRTLEGELEGAILTFTDVTDLSHALERESELLAIVESSQDAVYGRDLEGRVRGWNPGAEELYGYTVEEAEERGFEMLVPPDRRSELAQWEARVRRGERVGPVETDRLHKDGRRLAISLSLAPIRSSENVVIGLAAVARDMEAQRRAEAALRRAQERLQRLFASDLIGVLILDVEGTVLDANDYSLALLGGSREELEEGTIDWRERTPEDLLPHTLQAFDEVRRAGHCRPYETELRHPDGRQVPLLVGYAALPQEPGRLIGFALDLSERRAAEERRQRLEVELRERVEELAEGDARKDEFLAMLAHELRNPLAPITTGIELLRLRPSTGEGSQAKSTLDLMERQVKHLSRLVNDLLDVSRITRGKITLRRELVDLREVVEGAVEALEQVLEERGHRLRVTLPEAPIRLRGDAVRLQQVVGNLLHNAAKFTPSEGAIEVRLTTEDETAVLVVEDDGAGMEPALVDRVFDLFAQGDQSLARSEGGLGVGLTTVERLTALHGGTVTAESEGKGRGSRFIVRLPLADHLREQDGGEAEGDPAEGEPEEERRRSPVEPVQVPPGCKVLIVEDNRDAATGLAELLGLYGCEVVVAGDGTEGLARGPELAPDVVLLDIGLPGMDGFETARRLRATDWGQGALLVALTGYGQSADIERALAAGFDHHLLKPIQIEQLQRLLASVRPLAADEAEE